MEIKHIMSTARSATIEIADGGRHFTKKPYVVCVNGESHGVTNRTITSLFDLIPDTKQVVEVFA